MRFFLPGFFVRMVVDISLGAIGFVEGVVSLDFITVTVLVLCLMVMCVWVSHLVFELILRMSL